MTFVVIQSRVFSENAMVCRFTLLCFRFFLSFCYAVFLQLCSRSMCCLLSLTNGFKNKTSINYSLYSGNLPLNLCAYAAFSKSTVRYVSFFINRIASLTPKKRIEQCTTSSSFYAVRTNWLIQKHRWSRSLP